MSSDVYRSMAYNSLGLLGTRTTDPQPEGGMNSVAEDTRDILLDSGFDDSGTWNLTIGHEPAEPHLNITVYDTQGDVSQSHNRTLWYTDRIQIRVRGLNYSDTHAKMLSILKYLILKEPFQWEGADYKGYVSFGTPYYLGLDEQKRMTWSLNFGVHREEITNG